MIEWFKRLVGGWLPIGTKPFPEWLGKVLWCVGIVTLCLFVYHKMTQPTSNTNQKAEEITNYNQQPKITTFGCMRYEAMKR